jgi:ribosomal protein S18 acetylase RimI-like enzyme
MTSAGVPIPALEPPWPDDQKIAVVTSDTASPGWLRFAHEVATVVQPGGHSFPLAERIPGSDSRDLRRAFLYRRAAHVCGYLCLVDKVVTGYREASACYREAVAAERVTRPCVLVVWVAVDMRRRGIARHLVNAAAQYSGVTPSGLAWVEPFTDRGYWLARSMAPDGLWIADYG